MLIVPSAFMNIYCVSVACHSYKHVIHAFIFVLTLIVFIYGFPCCALCLCVPYMLHHCDRDAGESQHEPCQSDLHTHRHMHALTHTYTLLPQKPECSHLPGACPSPSHSADWRSLCGKTQLKHPFTGQRMNEAV